MLNKVAIVEPVGGHGGLDFYNIGLCEAIANQDIDVYLYTSDKTSLDNEIKDLRTHIEKFYCNIYNDDNKYIRGIRYILATFKSVLHAKKHKVQLVHFHIFNFSRLELFNLSLFKYFGIKVVATIHDVDKLSSQHEQHSEKIYERLEHLLDKVFVHTEFSQNELAKNFKKTKKDDIIVIPHGDMDFVYNVELSKEEAIEKLKLNIDKTKKIILLFGQIKKVKGLDILLEAFGRIHKNHTDALILVVGKLWKNDSLEYDEIIKKYNMEKQVKLHLIYIDNANVPLYFKLADIVALPYKKIYNSGVILRAMDYGSTVLVSDLDPLTDIISHNENGLVFKSEDIDDLAEKLNILLDDKELRLRLKQKAKSYIEQNFSWDVIGAKTIDAYNMVEGKI